MLCCKSRKAEQTDTGYKNGYERKCSEYANTLQYTQDQFKANQQQLADHIQLTSDLKTQIALLTQELTYSKEKLQHLSDQHHSLTQEKLYLIQEKSQLEGQVKQLDKIMTKRHVAEAIEG